MTGVLNTIQELDNPIPSTVTGAGKAIRAVIVRDLHGRLLGLVPIRKLIAALGHPGGSVRMEDVGFARAGADIEDATTEDLLSLMGRHRIRNLPVVAADEVVGLVSARDIEKTRARAASANLGETGLRARRRGMRLPGVQLA